MRVLTWNANQGLDRKITHIIQLDPDIAIICEAASPEISRYKDKFPPNASLIWVGENLKKGLLVVAFRTYQITIDQTYEPANKYIVPIRLSGPRPLNLLAVWSNSDRKDRDRKSKPSPIIRALRSSSAFLKSAPTVVAGDFNSNVVWDQRTRNPERRMTSVVTMLSDLGLASAYHQKNDEPFGSENQATIYWRDRTKDGPRYHIDYIFLPENWLKTTRFEMGNFDDWVAKKLSDHVPLWVDFEII
jgi:exodeoxyribonuclease-3